MKKGKFITKLLAIILGCVLVLGIAGGFLVNHFIIEKFNQNKTEAGEMLSGKDIFGYAKYLTDGNIIKNLQNFDKETAKEILGIIDELAAEMEEKGEIEKKPTQTKAPSNNEETAYDRIMKAATKEEIEKGMEIIGRVDMEEANRRYEEGGIKALKRYVLDTMNREDLRITVELYRKYEHLL